MHKNFQYNAVQYRFGVVYDPTMTNNKDSGLRLSVMRAVKKTAADKIEAGKSIHKWENYPYAMRKEMKTDSGRTVEVAFVEMALSPKYWPAACDVLSEALRIMDIPNIPSYTARNESAFRHYYSIEQCRTTMEMCVEANFNCLDDVTYEKMFREAVGDSFFEAYYGAYFSRTTKNRYPDNEEIEVFLNKVRQRRYPWELMY